MPLSGTQEGGALMFIDAANFSEQNTPANTTVSGRRPDRGRPHKPLNQGRGLSLFGRITTPYPLWDGTDRVLARLPAVRGDARTASSSPASTSPPTRSPCSRTRT